MDTSGFYKLDNDNLLYGKNEVWNKDYHLTRTNPPSGPVDGWHWFDSEAEARAFFGLPEVEVPEVEVPETDEPLI